MSNNTNLICFEVTTHLRAGEPQQIISCLENKYVGIVSAVQDSSNSCYVSRVLVFEKGTENLEEMKSKERLYLERIIAQYHLKVEVINVEAKFKEERTMPTEALDKYNPVCFQHYFMEEQNENK